MLRVHIQKLKTGLAREVFIQEMKPELGIDKEAETDRQRVVREN